MKCPFPHKLPFPTSGHDTPKLENSILGNSSHSLPIAQFSSLRYILMIVKRVSGPMSVVVTHEMRFISFSWGLSSGSDTPLSRALETLHYSFLRDTRFAASRSRLSWPESKNLQHLYERAEAIAKEQKAGLWQQDAPLAPWDFRRR